jgi:hypothetical protein
MLTWLAIITFTRTLDTSRVEKKSYFQSGNWYNHAATCVHYDITYSIRQTVRDLPASPTGKQRRRLRQFGRRPARISGPEWTSWWPMRRLHVEAMTSSCASVAGKSCVKWCHVAALLFVVEPRTEPLSCILCSFSLSRTAPPSRLPLCLDLKLCCKSCMNEMRVK